MLATLPARKTAVDELVANNLKLVYKFAHAYSRKSLEAYEDIEGAGMMGLVKAAKRYDPATGYRFSSIAVPWIRGEILHYLRSRGGVPRVPRVWQDTYMKGYGLSDADAAAKVGITLEAWQEIKQACSCWMVDWHPKYEKSWEPEVMPEESTELDQAKQALQQWLTALSETDRQLITSVYFKGKGRTKKVRPRIQAVVETFSFS
ncbi:MAG: sigma-70 family RNA polymerase sigma factor [Leptolyngbyaceae cyanobacterium CSU_1_4]|nr:sigma-70 family RNA polymerase sigma factor [Leptolyngbyaceae cyanobacterium CSU_1_4]